MTFELSKTYTRAMQLHMPGMERMHTSFVYQYAKGFVFSEFEAVLWIVAILSFLLHLTE